MQVPTPCYLSLVRDILRFVARSETEGTRHDSLIFGYEDGSPGSSHPQEVTYTTEGTTFMATTICGSANTFKETYSATATQFRVIRGPFDGSCDTGVTLELVYDKQP